MDHQRFNEFLSGLQGVPWFSQSGLPHPTARVIKSFQTGFDVPGSTPDGIWQPRSRALEAKAQRVIGDAAIDEIFAAVPKKIGDAAAGGLADFFERFYDPTTDDDDRDFQGNVDGGLFPEILDHLLRDVVWAAVEHVLECKGFFHTLLDLYREGRWVCSWDGKYPKGRPVVF